MAAALLIFAASIATAMGQFILHHQGVQPHPQPPSYQPPQPPLPPSNPFVPLQFPQFPKCMNEITDNDNRLWELWLKEYGCTSLFTSISLLSHANQASPQGRQSTVSPSETGHLPFAYFPSPRHRGHRTGRMYAGIGLSSDFYSGGFGRYAKIEDVALDPLNWKQAAPQKERVVFVGQPQHDALEEMTNERRRRDTQTCIDFRSLASKIVAVGPLENICCNIICYCDEVQNVSNSNRCGGSEWASQSTSPRPKSPPPPRHSGAHISDGIDSHLPETYVVSVQRELKEETDTSASVKNVTSSTQTINESSLVSSTTPTRFLVPSTTTEPSSSSSPTGTAPTSESSLAASLKKMEEILAGSLAASVLEADKQRRQLWSPVSTGGVDRHPFGQRRSYQFSTPQEWANFAHGDQGKR